MLKNLTQNTQTIDGKEFHFIADYDSNFSQVKTALIKMMSFFDDLEEKQRILQEQMKSQLPPIPSQEPLIEQPIEV